MPWGAEHVSFAAANEGEMEVEALDRQEHVSVFVNGHLIQPNQIGRSE